MPSAPGFPQLLGTLAAATVDQTYLFQWNRHDLPSVRVSRRAPVPERTSVANRGKLQNVDPFGPVVVIGAMRLQSRRTGHALRIRDLTPQGPIFTPGSILKSATVKYSESTWLPGHFPGVGVMRRSSARQRE